MLLKLGLQSHHLLPQLSHGLSQSVKLIVSKLIITRLSLKSGAIEIAFNTDVLCRSGGGDGFNVARLQ